MLTGMLLALALAGTTSAKELPVAPAPRSKVPQVEHTREFSGEVVAVDKRSITVRESGPALPGNGAVIRRFLGNDALARGLQDPWEKRHDDYRLTDVEVGDKVSLILYPSGDDDVCHAVRILRRPGGLVPPAPFEDPDVRMPYHVVARALQAFEEKGVPLPPELDPKVQAARDAWAREERKKYLEQRMKEDKGLIAPAPREVKRK